jgi:protein-tyrosine phosphatase
MKTTEPLVDIHCHILPGLDDGAADWNEALCMARMAANDGIAAVVATPHQLGRYAHNQAATIRATVARFQQMLEERGIPLRVVPGADVRIEPELVDKLRSGEVLSVADRRRQVLLELPHEIYTPLDRLLEELQREDIVGILTHPERNLGILNQPAVLRHLVSRGCLVQITAGSLLGHFGPRIRRFSESLLGRGLAHFVASDAHGTGSRPPLLRPAFERVAELAGRDVATELCCRNPSRLLSSSETNLSRPSPVEVPASSWFRRSLWSIASPKAGRTRSR